MALSTRQPFAELGTPRLQSLQSAKNRQNAITPTFGDSKFTSPLKPAPTPTTGKRSRTTSIFDDQLDAENIDPSIFNSPTKKSKTTDGFSKPSKFSLVTSPAKQLSSLNASPSIPSVRKALSSPHTTHNTPISHSRGSPKNKRLGLLSKGRRASSSPFRRVDPPSFTSSPGLPFSIDAALSGTIAGYTSKPAVATPAPPPVVAPSHVSTLEDSMPKGWFFEIHEDTPEQEAANLMEHSASVLDISSDDDDATKRRNEELERGKENIPPPDFLLSQPRVQSTADAAGGVEQAPAKMPRLRKMLAQDAMDEDRKPLGDLPAAEFYGEGLSAESYVTVDVGIERPSGLSKEFDFTCESPVKEAQAPVAAEEKVVEPINEQEAIAVFTDENAAPVVAEEQVVVMAAEVAPIS